MQHNTAGWPAFYAGRSGADYLRYAKERYAPFIKALIASIAPNDTVLELGAGTATITRALVDAHPVAQYVASDVNPGMLAMARERLEGRARTVQLDATRVPTLAANVVHSHGMLEHFDDETIRRVIVNHKHARAQVHYVPGLYPAPSYGDERLMSVDQWKDICSPAEVLTFNDGLDYALVFA